MSVILVVDDSPSIRLLLTRRLEMTGHTVLKAADGAGALNLIERLNGPDRPSLVLLDAMLPDSQGSGILNRMKAAEPSVPVVVVSAISGLATDEAWSAADGHVTKPIDFDDLLGRVEALTSGPPRP